MPHTITEHSSVYHVTHGWGTVEVRTYRYATVQFDSGLRCTVLASELTETRDYLGVPSANDA